MLGLKEAPRGTHKQTILVIDEEEQPTPTPPKEEEEEEIQRIPCQGKAKMRGVIDLASEVKRL